MRESKCWVFHRHKEEDGEKVVLLCSRGAQSKRRKQSDAILGDIGVLELLRAGAEEVTVGLDSEEGCEGGQSNWVGRGSA
jgi:hypothetical protein